MLPGTSRRPLAAVAALAALTLAAGCSTDDPVAERPASAPASRTVTPETPSPAAETSSAVASPTPTQTEAAARGLTDRLLPASALPGFNEQLTWQETGTSTGEPQEPFGTCQQFAFTSIGAMQVAVRDYAPAGAAQSSGGELVAEFADAKTAKRAYEVLKSWRAKCDLSDYRVHQVGQLQTVPVDGTDAVADWYLLVYGPPKGDTNAGYFDAQGFTRVGSRVAAVELRVVGQDYDYEPGHEPMVVALQAAAARLS
jgi:hypothetical protein